jgi:hypothetical protein
VLVDSCLDFALGLVNLVLEGSLLFVELADGGLGLGNSFKFNFDLRLLSGNLLAQGSQLGSALQLFFGNGIAFSDEQFLSIVCKYKLHVVR